jgi:hypothetical protein
MSTPGLRLSHPGGWIDSPKLGPRSRELAAMLALGVVPAAIALAVAVEIPNPNFLVVVGGALGAIAVIAFAVSPRYEISLALLTLYFGLLDGPIKLFSGSHYISATRDVLIGAICLGALVRLAVKREQVRLPPLSGWAIAWVALVLVETLNPETRGIGKALGGIRQQLEWVPFFFLGYIVMRSKGRFRQLFLLLGAIALINGVVSTYQTQLKPEQLARWGPGYAELIEGKGEVSSRTYLDSAGETKVRPMGLGSDMGFGGAVGVLALPGLLALLSSGRLRRRWLVLALGVGAVVAIATSLARTDVLGGVVALVAFGALSISAGRRAARALIAVLAIIAVAFVVASVLGSNVGKGVFSRYDSITPGKAVSTSVNYREKTLEEIPKDLSSAPFGAGLATVGAAAGFGGEGGALIEGRRASAESQYNYVSVELGLPGLLIWIALSVSVIALAARGLRRVEDPETRLYLAAIFASVITFTIVGFVGPTMSSLPFGPFFWMAVGVAAYWFKVRVPPGKLNADVYDGPL